MTDEVEWVLQTIADNWDLPTVGYGEEGYGGSTYSGTAFSDAPVKRINRDESRILEGDIRTRTGELKKANYIGATHADRATSPIGTEYNHDLETVVGIRIEGLHESEWGHVDPDGEDGLVWAEVVRTVRDALLAERTFPDASSVEGVSYTHLEITNEAPQSDMWVDFYRTDLDVVLSGFEDIG